MNRAARFPGISTSHAARVEFFFPPDKPPTLRPEGPRRSRREPGPTGTSTMLAGGTADCLFPGNTRRQPTLFREPITLFTSPSPSFFFSLM